MSYVHAKLKTCHVPSTLAGIPQLYLHLPFPETSATKVRFSTVRTALQVSLFRSSISNLWSVPNMDRAWRLLLKSFTFDLMEAGS